jgi:hypothetical protein
MKITGILGFIIVLTLLTTTAPKANALSCLPTEMYLKDIIGDENVVMFTGTAVKQIQGTGYTAEVIEVDTVKQGYVEQEVFVYHEKDETWGYLCNAGPDKKGTKGFYVATRDDGGKYNVAQRLATTDKLIKTLEADLKKGEIVGERVELTKTDRMNQILTTIQDLYEQIQKLFAEYKYWMSSK